MLRRPSVLPGVAFRAGVQFAAAVVLAGGVGAAVARDPSVPAPGAWSYAGATGPEHWADLSPAFAACREGQQQSPIDIRSVQPIPYEPLHLLYRTQTLDAVNDGRGIQVRSPRGSLLRVRGEDYDLTAFHLHTPGETLINGVAAAAEVHFVHRSTDGRHAIMVVPIQPGPNVNSTLARIVEYLPEQSGGRSRHRQIGVNPVLMLPPDRGYYTYVGSLGNPPCSEPVDWYILVQPIELLPEQLGQLARATGTNNVRPVQPLNGRIVYASLVR